jgi:hypothetical protein
MLRPVLAWRGYGGKGRCVKYIHMYVHTGRVWTAGFHHITARSRLACGLKFISHLFLQFPNFFLGRGKSRIKNQRIQGPDCTSIRT